MEPYHWKILGLVLYLAVLLGIGDVAEYFAAGKKPLIAKLEELTPAFVLAMVVGVLVSLAGTPPDVASELDDAGA